MWIYAFRKKKKKKNSKKTYTYMQITLHRQEINKNKINGY